MVTHRIHVRGALGNRKQRKEVVTHRIHVRDSLRNRKQGRRW
jgi:hypothetical protein